MDAEEKSQVRLLVAGNVNSFKWLYDKYFDTVYQYAFLLLKSNLWVDDVVSDVFISVWKSRYRIDPDQAFLPYLNQIVKNKVINRLNKIAADHRQEKIFWSNYADQKMNENMAMVDRQQMDVYLNYLQQLPTKRQDIFRRKYIRGQKLSEIAADLDISINTVKVHLAKARLFLKENLSDWQNSETLIFIIGGAILALF